jgi:hypothetical protein
MELANEGRGKIRREDKPPSWKVRDNIRAMNLDEAESFTS